MIKQQHKQIDDDISEIVELDNKCSVCSLDSDIFRYILIETLSLYKEKIHSRIFLFIHFQRYFIVFFFIIS